MAQKVRFPYLSERSVDRLNEWRHSSHLIYHLLAHVLRHTHIHTRDQSARPQQTETDSQGSSQTRRQAVLSWPSRCACGGALHPLRGPPPRRSYRHAAARKTSAVAALAAPHLSLRPRAAPARRLAAAAALPRREPPLMGRSRGSPRARLAPLPTPAEKTPSLLSIHASLLSNLSLSWQMIACNCQMAVKTAVSAPLRLRGLPGTWPPREAPLPVSQFHGQAHSHSHTPFPF